MPKAQTPKESAIAQFEEALKLFNNGELTEAKESFNTIIVTYSDFAEIVERSRTYLNIVTSKTLDKEAPISSRDNKYYLAIKFYNNGELDQAEEIVKSAAGKSWNDRELYLMSLINFEKGEIDKGLEVLKKSIEKNPINRILAYNNSNLSKLHKNPGFKELIESRKSS